MVRTPSIKIIVYGHLVGFDPTSLDLKGRCSSSELQMHMVFRYALLYKYIPNIREHS